MTWHARDGMHESRCWAANDPIGRATSTHQFQRSLAISSNTSQHSPRRNGLLPRCPPLALPRRRRSARHPLRTAAVFFLLCSPPALHRRLAATASPASGSPADSRSAQVGGRLLLRRCRRWGVLPVRTGGCIGGPPPGWRGVRGGAGEGPPRVAAPCGLARTPSKSDSVFGLLTVLFSLNISCYCFALAEDGMERVGHDRGGEGRGRIPGHCRCIPKEGGLARWGNIPFRVDIFCCDFLAYFVVVNFIARK